MSRTKSWPRGRARSTIAAVAVALGLPCAAAAAEYELGPPASYVLAQSFAHTGLALTVSVRRCSITATARLASPISTARPFARVRFAIRGQGHRRGVKRGRAIGAAVKRGRVAATWTVGPLRAGRYRLVAAYPGDRRRAAAGPVSATVRVHQCRTRAQFWSSAG